MDKIDYGFPGTQGVVTVDYEAWDVDSADEVEIYINDVFLDHVPVTGNNQWGEAQSITLTGDYLLEENANILTFSNRGNPPDRWIWGIRSVEYVSCADLDQDGYGDPASPACENPALDCDDSNAGVHPGMTEIPRNGIDDDCNPKTPPWGIPASVVGIEYGRSSEIVNTLLIILPFGAFIFLRILRRKK